MKITVVYKGQKYMVSMVDELYNCLKSDEVQLKRYILDVLKTQLSTSGSQLVNTESLDRESSYADHMFALLDELKDGRPILSIPIPTEQEDVDEKFGSYLATLMKNIPKRQKKILQGKMIAMVINETEN